METKRLRLRELIEGDAGFLLELLNDPSFVQNIGDRGVRTDAHARAYVRNGPVASYREHGFGLWAVELRESGSPIGICGLLRRDVLEAPDIGFALLPRFQSSGYGYEAARAVLDYARDTLRLRRVVAIVNADNEVSARLLTKLGMRFDRMVQPSPDEPPLCLFAVDLAD